VVRACGVCDLQSSMAFAGARYDAPDDWPRFVVGARLVEFIEFMACLLAVGSRISALSSVGFLTVTTKDDLTAKLLANVASISRGCDGHYSTQPL